MVIKFLFVVCFFIAVVSGEFMNITETARYGVDVSSVISSSVASCLVSSGNTFVIPRGYRSSGAVDTNVCTSLVNAANAGVKTRDVYLFPCKFIWMNFLNSNNSCPAQAQLAPNLLLLKSVNWFLM
jgi:hypothetical protein